jgi:hypothetical protein
MGWFSLLMVLASMSVITARLLDAPPLQSANDRSRWATVWSLGERGTYQIDEIRRKPGWDTIDKVLHEGHFYSTKPPLLPRLVTELYRWIRWGTGWTLTDQTEEVTRLILFLINVIPFGIALWVFSKLILRYCSDRFGQLFLITSACWGTLLLPFLTVFNNHTIATTCFIFTLALLLSVTAEERRHGWRFALCGLLAAFGVCNELPAAVFGLAVFFLLLRSDFKRTVLWFVPAALVPLIGFFVTNYHATGGWKPFYMYYGTEKYEFVHQGIPSYWADPQGIDRAIDPPLTYLFHCTLGHHGILSLTPIFLLTLAGWLLPGQWWRSKLREVILLGIGLTAVVLGFYLSKTENYNYGGVSVALRWTLWLVPFWLLAMIPVFNRLRVTGSTPDGEPTELSWTRQLGERTVRGSVMLLLCVSIFSAWYPRNAPWTQPWLFRLMERAEWIDYSDPRPQFDRKHFTWIGAIPDGTGETGTRPRMRFESVDAEGRIEAIELADVGPHPNREGVRVLSVSRTRPSDASRERSFLIDVERFRSGASVEEFLLDVPPFTVSEEDRRFFQGVPEPTQYFSSRIRYVRTPLRKDAFRCHVGYTYFTQKREDGRVLRFVRDVWYCEELPFGLLQWEDRVIDARTNTVLSRRFWKATAIEEE